MNGYGSQCEISAIEFSAIQMIDANVWATMYRGVPKNRASFSALRPNGSSPNAPNGPDIPKSRLDHVPDDLDDAAVLSFQILPQLLVQLDPDEQDDRGDVEEGRDEVDAE